jgi:hypothetical protein
LHFSLYQILLFYKALVLLPTLPTLKGFAFKILLPHPLCGGGFLIYRGEEKRCKEVKPFWAGGWEIKDKLKGGGWGHSPLKLT